MKIFNKNKMKNTSYLFKHLSSTSNNKGIEKKKKNQINTNKIFSFLSVVIFQKKNAAQ